jgi:hypothetical protein
MLLCGLERRDDRRPATLVGREVVSHDDVLNSLPPMRRNLGRLGLV